jgi:hypothetical protein
MDTNSFRDREEKRQSSFKVMYDFAAGILWLGAGVFFLAGKYLGGKLIVDSLLSTIFGIACVCYGVFRLYRVFMQQKNDEVQSNHIFPGPDHHGHLICDGFLQSKQKKGKSHCRG